MNFTESSNFGLGLRYLQIEALTAMSDSCLFSPEMGIELIEMKPLVGQPQYFRFTRDVRENQYTKMIVYYLCCEYTIVHCVDWHLMRLFLKSGSKYRVVKCLKRLFMW